MLAAPPRRLLAPAGFLSAPRIDAGYGAIVAAGLLVGFGTRYGSGCTSGHGVCGLSRLSPRSLVATLAFMARGLPDVSDPSPVRSLVCTVLSNSSSACCSAGACLLSGMTDPGKVQGFLDLFGTWDPSLAFVMGGAIAVGMFAFALAKRRSTTFFGGAMHMPNSRDIDKRLVVGSLIFGAGWGLAGFCPGPGIVTLAAGGLKAAIFVAAMLVGMLVYTAAIA